MSTGRKIEIRRTDNIAVVMDADEIVRTDNGHGEFSLIHSKKYGTEIVYQNGNPICNIVECNNPVLLRLHSQVAMRVIKELVKKLKDIEAS